MGRYDKFAKLRAWEPVGPMHVLPATVRFLCIHHYQLSLHGEQVLEVNLTSMTTIIIIIKMLDCWCRIRCVEIH